MSKAGQHHNDAVDPAKPRGHERSRGRNHPERSEPITTGTYKKPETYRKQAYARDAKTSDRGRQPQPEEFDAFGLDVRDEPTTSGSPRARASDVTGGRSGSRSNAS